MSSTHRKLHYIRGIANSDIPKDCVRKFGGKSSHDCMTWGLLYSNWCLDEGEHHKAHEDYLDLMSRLMFIKSGKFLKSHLETFYEEMIEVLCKLEGCLPVTEAKYTKHEIIHVIHSILQCGPPLMTNIFKHERVNKYLKRLRQNRRYPIPSIAKNYLVRTHTTCFYTNSCACSWQNILAFIPLARSTIYCTFVN